MAGWLTEKYTTILRGPYMLYWKERRESRKIVGLFLHLRRYILEKIPDEVMKKHDINRALKDQDEVEKIAKQIIKKGFKLAFNVQLGEEKALGLIKKIEEAWERAERRDSKLSMPLKQIKKDFQNGLLKVLEECNAETKDTYWHQLEPIIKVAEKSGEHGALMQKAALLFKTENVSRLAATAFRWEARGARKDVIKLNRYGRVIEKLLKGLNERGAKVDKIVNDLRILINMIIDNTKDEFKSTYLLLKRDFLLHLVMLRLLDQDESEMMGFVREHLMPSTPEMKNIRDVEEIKKELAKNAHTLAQGFRRLIEEENSVISLAKKGQ